jgi:pimeloyl-ACP methyl ester carboxylesterase
MAYRKVGDLAVREWGDTAGPGILLWPGMGFTSAYFAGSAPLLPSRSVGVDTPGWGRSPVPSSYSYEQLVGLAAEAIRACDCRAMVGHSLAGDIALGVAADPPPGLRAVVLVDGGYLEPADRVALGAPDAADREAVVAFMRQGEARFPDWETARGEIAKFVGTEELTPETEAAFRESLTEIDGEFREVAPPERAADLLTSITSAAIDVRARAAAVRVPTLLIAAGQPPESREIKQRAWERFAAASPFIELHVAEDWGHNALLANTQECTAVIGAWLSPHLERRKPC